METITRKRPVKQNPVEQEITLDKDAPQLSEKYQTKKRKPVIEVPPEKAKTFVTVTPNVDDILNKLLIKTEPKVKATPIEDVVVIRKKMEIATPLHNNPAINNALVYQKINNTTNRWAKFYYRHKYLKYNLYCLY